MRTVEDYEDDEGGPEKHQADSAPELALHEADPVVAVVAGEQGDRRVGRAARARPVREFAGVEVAELSFTPTDAFPTTRQHQLAFATPWVDYIVHVIVAPHESLLLAEVEIADTLDGFFHIFDLLFLFLFT